MALTSGSSGGANNYNYGAMGGGLLGAGLGQLFGNYQNPADSAMGYYNQIPGQLNQYMSPYINAGMGQLPGLQNQYNSLMNNPGGMVNQIGSGYQQSPGYQFQVQQAMQGGNNAAAAGGMAGSPQHEQQNMQMASNIANQDYNQYMQNALGLYGQGLQGSQGLYNTGAQAGMGMGEDMASLLAQQGNLAYQGQNAQNQQQGGMFGSLFGGLGTLAGGFFL